MLSVVALAGCGARAHSVAPSASVTASALKGSPTPLATLHAEGGKLLSGGVSAFRSRLAALRGYPVVVNKWASWCGPCQSEFPIFQRAALDFGRRVAFVGVDANDHLGAARSFLRSHPVSYPSFSDPGQTISAALHAASYFPQTVFLSPAGRVIYDHIGAYASATALDQDIRRHALAAS